MERLNVTGHETMEVVESTVKYKEKVLDNVLYVPGCLVEAWTDSVSIAKTQFKRPERVFEIYSKRRYRNGKTLCHSHPCIDPWTFGL